MAFLLEENGKAVVAAALTGRAAISIVNWAEVLSKVAERGSDPAAVNARYRERGFIGGALLIEPMIESDCLEVARLRPITKPQGLSLADRACLTLGARLEVPVLTTDSAWADAKVPVEVRLIR
jgi:PIN domain nuclease of toxin-antitoxin system